MAVDNNKKCVKTRVSRANTKSANDVQQSNSEFEVLLNIESDALGTELGYYGMSLFFFLRIGEQTYFTSALLSSK